MEVLIQRAVEVIQERYCEPLSLEELAQAAIMSKFHFLRTFRDVTGVTPGRFLSAVRLEAAKELLATTPLNVSDISAQVGYGSAGSFTRRFTESVGCSPTQYRNRGPGDLGSDDPEYGGEDHNGPSIRGAARSASPRVSAIYIGVFDGPILERSPAAHAIITAPGRFCMSGVPQGSWYIHAAAYGPRIDGISRTAHTLFVDSVGPLEVGPDRCVEVNLTVRPRGWSHPPVLLALPNLSRLDVAA